MEGTGHDQRELLPLLKAELAFMRAGGYSRDLGLPWQSLIPLRDSRICLNYDRPNRPHSCSRCHLTRFVPSEFQGDLLPCHHIALNERGETIAALEGAVRRQVMEQKLAVWLEQTIRNLEDREAVASAE